jgi:hypothetical protein
MASVQYPSTRFLTGRAGHVLFLGLCTCAFALPAKPFPALFWALNFKPLRLGFRAPSFLHLYFCALNFFSRYWFPFALPVSFSLGVSIYIHSHTRTVHTSPHPYIHLHTHTYIPIHIHTPTHTYVQYIHPTHIHTYKSTYIHTHEYRYIRKYIHTDIDTYSIYIHTYIHTKCTYIHTYMRVGSWTRASSAARGKDKKR